MGDQPHVVAVVLNWNRRDETLGCMRSLAESDWPRLSTVVVDNGSEEDIRAEIADGFADATVIRNASNLGFAGGMNTGLREALDRGADYALLLNNDTLLETSTVTRMVEAAVENPDAGIISPLVLYRDAPDIVYSAGLRCDLRRCYQGGPIGCGERDDGQYGGVREVDAVSGAAMLVSLQTIRDVGMLDEGLYLYIEDVDWALRMRESGLRVLVAGDARLWHGVSVSSGGEQAPQARYYHTRNTFVVCNRHLPMRGPRGVFRHLDILVSNLISACRGPQPLPGVRAVLAGWRDYVRGRLGPSTTGFPVR